MDDRENADVTPISKEAEVQPSKFDNVEDVPTNFAVPWQRKASSDQSSRCVHVYRKITDVLIFRCRLFVTVI